MKTEKKHREMFDKILKEFEIDEQADEHWVNGGEMRVFKISSTHEVSPTIVFLVFGILKKYKHFGRGEKVAWRIPLKYKGTPILFSHEKFGLRVYIQSDQQSSKFIVSEALTRIKKASTYAEKLISPVFEERINLGCVTLRNQYHSLRARYEYFRELAEDKYEEVAKLNEPKNKSASINHSFIPGFVDTWNQAIQIEREASYNLIAMMDAYFSYLEHFLVLVLPFVESCSISVNLSKFIGFNWGDKYKQIFNLKTNMTALNRFQELQFIKESYRNILSHGNLQKNGGSLLVHMPVMGAVPVQLTNPINRQSYGFVNLQEYDFKKICSVFDKCDDFFQSGITLYGFLFIESGLSVPFNEDSKNRFKLAMKSTDTFREMIEIWGMMEDDAVNMDW